MAEIEERALEQPRTALLAAISVFHGIYYIVSGVWPILHLPSFEFVTGPKKDDWLVKTVGLLITAIGAALVMAGVRRKTPAEMTVLAGGSAVGLTAIDIVYVARGRIRPVYLLDALAEVALLAAWGFAWLLRR